MFRKGDRCFHEDYGNGLIKRVTKKNVARIHFDRETDPEEDVWLSVDDIEEALPEDEVEEALSWRAKSVDSPKAGLLESERKPKRAFKAPVICSPAKTVSEFDTNEKTEDTPSKSERGAIKVLEPVSPIRLYEMPMPAPNIETFCNKYTQCISAEIYESRNRFRLRRMMIHHGECVNAEADPKVYALELDSEAYYPDGAVLTIWRSRQSEQPLGSASVASCDGTFLMIESKDDLPNDISGMYYSIDEAALLEALNDRLSELKSRAASPIVSDLVLHPREYVLHQPIAPTQLGQSNALERACRSPITFIWGPPGTGKTETLARIVHAHIALGHRILMVSQSNVSVDAAILRVRQLDPAPRDGSCVRYGYPRAPELVENEHLTVSVMALKTNLKRYAKRTELARELSRTLPTNPRYLEIRKEIEKLNESVMQEEKSIVRKANFIATTVSKAVIDRSIYQDNSFDVVLFDEASMALVPQIVFAASLAQGYFVCAGDFSQLPPITRANRSALEADIYQYTGISEAVSNRQSHAWLTMLDTQYRMHAQIADFAGHHMYSGLLKNAPSTDERKSIAACRPVSGEAIVLLHLEGSQVTSVDSSKINLMSALMAFGTALNIVYQNQSIGIITPYSPQARLLRCMARDFADAEPFASTITCSTIHQFQGSEKDVILYDVAETSARSVMLVKNENNYANRLFNVAITRARGKLCLLADKEFVYNQLPQNLMLTSLVLSFYRHSVNIRRQFDAAVCTFPYAIMRAFNGEKLVQEVSEDIARADSSAFLLMSPDLQYFLRQTALIDRILARHAVSARFKLHLCTHNPSLFGLSAKLFTETDSPETLLLLDQEILWYFYLSAPDKFCGIRFRGKQTIRRIQAIFFSGNRSR